MDSRKCLENGANLQFPGMNCTIESLVGKGSNAIVYLASYPDQHQPGLYHLILVKELFPYHPGGAIYRDGRDDICCEADGEDTMRLHRISFVRGNEVHLRMQNSRPGDFDLNINTFSCHRTLYTVMGFSGGRSLEDELGRTGAVRLSLTDHIRRILHALDILEVFHASGYLHLDISPDNILLIGGGKRERVSLIDYNSVHTIEEIRNGREVYYSAKTGYTAPEISMKRISLIGFSTDIYALTAVFYRCITGRNLPELQAARGAAWDLSDAGCLEGMPDTVVSKVRQILKRGLAPVGRHRYRNTYEMRVDLEELTDRIEGKGITHWALWESGQAGARRMIRTNPAFEYIREDEEVYPIAGICEDGDEEKMMKFEELCHSLISENGSSVMLVGEGGMGKTTALLRMAYLQDIRYSAASPAVIYISLYGWNNSGGDYIVNKILESLRFKPETSSIETARYELIRLLSAPIYSRFGKRPKVLLLLDGWNEASGDPAPLAEEIVRLAGMSGVRLVAASRSPAAGVGLTEVKLRMLEEAETADILSKKGILLPENQELRQLLRTPMMLSIYIKTVSGGRKQIFMEEQEQNPQSRMLSLYLGTLLEKEKQNLPEESSERWIIEAAVYYVLPEIASFLKGKGASVSDRELLALIEKCYRRLSKRDMAAVFPQWIGHLSDIRGGAETAEEWYGVIVHRILWRRLGLVVREEDGGYRVIHQLIEEYLAEICMEFRRKFLRRQRLRTGAAVLSVLLAGVILRRCLYLPYISPYIEEVKNPYDEKLAENVLDTAFVGYETAARQYDALSEFLDCMCEEEIDGGDYEWNLSRVQSAMQASGIDYTDRTVKYEESLLDTGDVMPWSGQALDTEAYEGVAAFSAGHAEEYQGYLEILTQMREDTELWETYGEDCAEAFRQVIDCDARMAGVYYKLTVDPELRGMEASESEETRDKWQMYQSAKVNYPKQNRITDQVKGDWETFRQYEADREQAVVELHRNAGIELIERRGKRE